MPSPGRVINWWPVSLLTAAAALMPAQAPAQEPSLEPMLRLDTGMHTAKIFRAATDAAGRVLATASYDKTVRLWSLETGELIRVLRPPIGVGHEGELNAVAMSPDGRLAATGGYTGYETYSIYVFEAASGRLIRRVGGLPSSIDHLAWSPDGGFVVAALWGSNGIRVYRTSDWEVIAGDADYADNSYGASFDRSGRLAVVGYDGYVRLYDRDSEFGGLGIRFALENGHVKVVSLGEDSPAARAGLKPGDLITQVDGEPAQGMTLPQAVEKMRGPVGSEITLTIRREGREPFDVTLTRATIKVQYARSEKVKTPGGGQLYSVAFSPDGTRFAVGYNDTTNLTVFSVPDLQVIFSPDTSGLVGGSLSAVAWTTDGALLAGGRYQAKAGDVPIARWPEASRSQRQELAAADDTVMSIVPLADRGFVYASADPAFGRYDGQLQRRLDRRSDIIDFRGQREALRLSADGVKVAFGLERGALRPAWFDAKERHLELGPKAESLDTADTTSLPITDWQSGHTPKLAGKTLELATYETSRSVAIALDRRSFLMGADWWLRRFDSDGKVIWSVPVPDVAWAVNVSRDGRLTVAALGDGTIRWYRYEDGKELLALFVHRDGKRWVLWTPGGYYDASPGGEDLIGWHINRGLDDAADFFPASRFRERFYRPAAVGAVLRTLDIDKALEATASPAAPSTPLPLPPVVTILSPQEGDGVKGSTVDVHYVVRSPSGERVTSVQVLVDGRPLEGQRGVPLVLENGPAAPEAESEQTVTVPVDHNEQISLIARAGERAGEAATIKVLWKGEKPFTAPQGRLYLLAVGISDYRDEALKLHYAAKDAKDVVAAFERQKGDLYGEVVPKLLRDGEATRAAILTALQWLEEKTKKNDVALVFLSGHGINDGHHEYYFLAQDSDPGNLRATAVPNSEFAKTLSQVHGKALFFFDTCHSGSVSVGGNAARPDVNGVVNALASAENGLVVFAASTGSEFAYERGEWGNGAFTKALVEALTGAADKISTSTAGSRRISWIPG